MLHLKSVKILAPGNPRVFHAARAVCTIAAWLAIVGPAAAQQVRELKLQSVPPDMLQAPDDPSGARPAIQGVDLGEQLTDPGDSGAGAATGARPSAASVLAPAQQAAMAARGAAARATGATVRRVARPAADVERAVFRTEPVRVTLAVGAERLITLPAPAVLSVPTDIEHVARIEIIGPTLYVTPLTAFHRIRIVAELIDSGQQIPMDFVAGLDAKGSLPELEVSVLAPAVSPAGSDATAKDNKGPEAEQTGADMVQLTRHAARQLYAPRRLAWTTPGVHQVDVATKPVPTLIRGVDADVVPLGQWKSGPLYVTAVRVTNRSAQPLEIPLEQVRGRWIAATSQHGRIGRTGTETDTTAIYLVCDRPFEACL
jgi:integrating conjugative element protein (TIGR03749 family)